MVEVVLYRDREGRPAGFQVDGHAGFDIYGKDIVCAAVSVLAQTTVMGLEHYLPGLVERDVSPGRLVCRLKGGLTPEQAERAGVILGTMELGLEATAVSYAKYLRLRKEVQP